MRTNKLAGLVAIASFISVYIPAQTPGTLSFETTLTSHSGEFGSSHVVAIWIEDGTGNFIKTRLRRAQTNHTIKNHLPVWKANSNLNVVDATTGATLTSYTSPITISWDGTDVSGNIVADGTYRVFIEESWEDGSSGTSFTSVAFEKGSSAQNLSPSNTPNFTNMSLSWVPSNVSAVVNTQPEPNKPEIYPNPSNGKVTVDFKGLTDVSTITIYDTKGAIVQNYALDKNIMGTKHLDLSGFPKGIYFISVFSESGITVLTERILLQ